MKQYTPPVLSVSELNRQIRFCLENDIGEVSVMGELSNLSKPRSGHLYFTLKDNAAQLRCVYFRNYHLASTKELTEGEQVLVKGQLSLYEARGDYQLIVHTLTRTGLGELYRQFEALKLKLEAAGLFSSERKKPIPRFPKVIGVITSPTGAALHDILTTLARRYPLAKIEVYASEVQGKEAATQLIKAVQLANQRNTADVLLLARGGGSLEDLWSFNDEQLAMVISQSLIPIVTGIGHETDFTIADFVADQRAATPTAAAETVTPHGGELLNLLHLLQKRLSNLIQHQLERHQIVLTSHLKKITTLKPNIMKHWQTLDFLERQLCQSMSYVLQNKQSRLQLILMKLQNKDPHLRLQQYRSTLRILEKRLFELVHAYLQQQKQRLQTCLSLLHTVSPLATLDRGYAIVSQHQEIVTAATQINKGDKVHIQLAKGTLDCEVLNSSISASEQENPESTFS